MPKLLSRSDFMKGHPTPSPRRIGKGEGRVVHPLGLSFTWKVTGADTGYAFAVYEMEMPSEASIPLHTHPFAEFFYILDGALEVLMLDADGTIATVPLSTGECANAPANAPHGLRNVSGHPARFLSVANFEHEEAFNRIERRMAEMKAETMSMQEQAEAFIGLAAQHQVYFFDT